MVCSIWKLALSIFLCTVATKIIAQNDTTPVPTPATTPTPANPPTSTARTADVVEYKYVLHQFDILPYDEPFTLKITGLPTGINKIDIKMYEIRGNYNLFKDRNIITEDEFKKLTPIKTYVLDTWKRPVGDLTNEAWIVIPFSLRPNSRYIFNIEPVQHLPLSDEQKKELRDIIYADTDIATIFNQLGDAYNRGTYDSKTFPNAIVGLEEKAKNLVKDIPKARYEANPDITALTGFAEKILKDYRVLKNNIDKNIAESKLAEAKQQDSIYKHAQDSIKNLPDSIRKLTTTKEESESLNNQRKDLQKKVSSVTAIQNTAKNLWDLATTDSRDIDRMVNNLKSQFPASDDLAEAQKVEEVGKKITDLAASARQLVDKLVEAVILENIIIVNALGSSYPLNMVEQANHYIGLDLGYAYVGNFSSFVAYTGLNIYFRPVNKNIPLSRYKTFKDIFTTRTSLLIGITLESVDKPNVRKGIIGNNAIIIGTGVRLNSWFRINGGGLLYYRHDFNPLLTSTRQRTRVSPFVSFSVDMDVQQLLGGVGRAIFKIPQ